MPGALNPAWRGGHAGYRGPNWKRQRAAALERDGHACRSCGVTERLTVNHVRPFRLFASHEEANRLDNLLTLCRPCHTAADNAVWKEVSHLLDSTRSSFPDCRILRDCDRCGQQFEAASAGRRCLACCTYTCDWCHATFVSRKRRDVRFCSRECNQGFRQSLRIYPHACIACGKAIDAGRFRCRACHLKAPAVQVRPGRKNGRPPKGQPAT
jgi:hypothetical protein